MRHAVTFTGDAEAFRSFRRRDARINLLLGGFYSPVVKRKAAQWLAQHTSIGGVPLEQVPVAQPRWPAGVLIALFIALRVANDFQAGPPLPLVILAGMLMIPYLWGTTARRRVDATRWRGTQLRFTATWRGVYAASWPLYLVSVPWACIAPTVADSAHGAGPPHIEPWLLETLAAGVLVACPLLVRLLFNWKRLLVTSTRTGERAAQWDVRFGEYLRIWLATTAVFLVCVVPVVAALRYAMFGTVAAPKDIEGAQALLVPLAGAVVAVILSSPVRAWHEARMFKLLWDRVHAGDAARFECSLAPREFVRLRVRNVARTLATFGRSRPEAVVAEYRMKVQAVTLVTAQEKV